MRGEGEVGWGGTRGGGGVGREVRVRWGKREVR